jgi:protein-S-isoprenylcysteine O-methyltransferase Ste14
LTGNPVDLTLLTVAPDTKNIAPDRTPVKRWAKVRLWTGYIYILCAIIFGKPIFVWAIVGFLLVILGAAIRLISSATLVKDKELVTHGIYGMTRNPLYLGSAFVAFGFASMSSSFWILGACLIIMAPIYARMISLEEKYLVQLFPDTFPAYMKSVPRFFPDLTKIGKISGTLDISRMKKSGELTSTILFVFLSLVLLLVHRIWIPG